MDHLHRHCTCVEENHDPRHRVSNSEEPPEDEYRRLPQRATASRDRTRGGLTNKRNNRPRR